MNTIKLNTIGTPCKAGGGGGTPINNQEKSVDITENGTTEVVADEGFTGLSKVVVNTNVQSEGDFVDIPILLPLYIQSLTKVRKVKFSNPCEYSFDNKTWNELAKDTFVSIPIGGRVYLRATGLTPGSYGGIGSIDLDDDYSSNPGLVEVGGNVMSMLYGSDFLGKETIPTYAFQRLFEHCILIKSAEKLILPATTLAKQCYSTMFYNCSSLVTAPALPATTLARSCYSNMFSGCSSLVAAPALPATTLAVQCYRNMFYNCSSLVTAPALPATTLEEECYGSMFYNCSSLVTAPALPATEAKDKCYSNMFSGCSSLVTAPALPATTGNRFCYSNMFYGCAKLNTIKAMFINDITSYTDDWTSGLAAQGVFIKNTKAEWDLIGRGGVPEGWTIAYTDE